MKHYLKLLSVVALVAMTQVACNGNNQPPDETLNVQPDAETYAIIEASQKIGLVERFSNCYWQAGNPICIGADGKRERIETFLSMGAVATVQSEHDRSIKSGTPQCSYRKPICYSGIWTVNHHERQVYQESQMRLPPEERDYWYVVDGYAGMRVNLSSKNPNQLILTYKQGEIEQEAYFSVVKEGGQWKIDNTTRAFASSPNEWWR